jgi:hypothetical protein
LDWLQGFGIPKSIGWGIWGIVVLISLCLLIWAWRREVDTVYLVALAVALGFVISPYTLQYDYPMLALALFWVYWRLPQVAAKQRWVGLAILVFLFSVLLWEGPISDGYWIALGLGGLLLWLGWPRPVATTPTGAKS